MAPGVSGWVEGVNVARKGSESGPLSGLKFAVKDLFDIRGHTASFGNPHWRATHPAAIEDAPVIAALLNAGAELSGVTVLDELAFSIAGSNEHQGTPVNKNAPGRTCGGSSSGSAAVTAAGLCDFALGTDTGGSVRVPASYCGLFGIRPTHNRIPLVGLAPLAPSYDCIGWLSRDGDTLNRVGRVLGLSGSDDRAEAPRLLLPRDAWRLAGEPARSSLSVAARELAERLRCPVDECELAREGLDRWHLAFLRQQRREIWRGLGHWVLREKPAFGSDVATRLENAQQLAASHEGVLEDQLLRERIRKQLVRLLGDGTLLCVPSTPGPAPPCDLTAESRLELRSHTMQITCIAGLGGLPEASLPLGNANGLPVGLSVIANRGDDGRLLALAAEAAR